MHSSHFLLCLGFTAWVAEPDERGLDPGSAEPAAEVFDEWEQRLVDATAPFSPGCERYDVLPTAADFERIAAANTPVVFSNAWNMFGPRVAKWHDPAYLQERYGDVEVGVSIFDIDRTKDNGDRFTTRPVQRDDGAGYNLVEPHKEDWTLRRVMRHDWRRTRLMAFAEQASAYRLDDRVSEPLPGRPCESPVSRPKLWRDVGPLAPMLRDLSAEVMHLNLWFGKIPRAQDGRHPGRRGPGRSFVKEAALHFDAQDNVLLQLAGNKTVMMYGMADWDRMYPHRMPLFQKRSPRDLRGGKRKGGGAGEVASGGGGAGTGAGAGEARGNFSPFNPLAPDYSVLPLARGARLKKCELTPGDALYMPALTWHDVISTPDERELNVAANAWLGARCGGMPLRGLAVSLAVCARFRDDSDFIESHVGSHGHRDEDEDGGEGRDEAEDDDETEDEEGAGVDDRVRVIKRVAALDGALSELDALDAAVERYRARLTEVDPVSGNPRYGPKMAAKVSAAIAQFDELLAEVQHAREAAEPALAASAVAEAERAQAAREAEEAEALRREAALEAAAAAERDAATARAATDAAQAAQHEAERAELAVRAEAARAERQARQDAEAEVRAQRAAAARDAAEQLAARMSAAGTGRAVAAQGAAELREEFGPPGSASCARVLSELLMLARNVENAPDNALFRTLRIGNAKVATLVGHAGAVRCLSALGFRVQVRRAGNKGKGEGDETAGGGDGGGGESETKGDDGGDNDGGGAEQEQACLWMDEPNIERDLDGWSEWFDNIKAVREQLEQETAVQPLGAAASGAALDALAPVSFRWRADGRGAWGFVAQDVQQAVPRLVDESDHHTLRLHTLEMVPLLVRQVQDLRRRCAALEATAAAGGRWL
eukprot:g2543.t1